MGLFFERRMPGPDMTALLTKAYETSLPADEPAAQAAASMAAELHPLVSTLTTALGTKTPANPASAASHAAQSVSNELLGGVTFNTGRFVIAFLMFAALVGGGIACEATHLTTASGTLFGFAGAIFGIVTAFLGTESATTNQG